MQAISVFTSGMIAPFFQQLPDTKYEECLNKTYFRMIPIEHLDKIRALLRKYNYDVPIIDICSGIPYKENKKYRKYAKIATLWLHK